MVMYRNTETFGLGFWYRVLCVL